MTEKNAAYWAGYREEAAKIARRGHIESLAQQVARAFGLDNGRKQKIIARSPGVFSGMDAEEFGRMSSTELATRELKALGIEPGQNDPIAILDAHHSGRQFAKDYLIHGGRPTGNGNKPTGSSASDAREGGSFIDKYLGS